MAEDNFAAQRQIVVTAYFKSKQLLLFAFARLTGSIMIITAITLFVPPIFLILHPPHYYDGSFSLKLSRDAYMCSVDSHRRFCRRRLQE